MSELKCCPFCGGEVRILSYDWGYSVKEYWCHCSSCNCSSSRYHSKEEAIKYWNTRTPMANIVENIVTSLESEKTVFLGTRTEQTDTILIDDAINIVKQEINNGLE